MSASYPTSLKTILDNEIKVTAPTSDETVKKVVLNANFLLKLYPIGSIIPFASELSGIPVPIPTLYQSCDATEITDPTSPLATSDTGTRLTPDFSDHYPRGAADTSGNNTGGAATVSVSHSHTGHTGNNTNAAALDTPGTDFDDQPNIFHTHVILPAAFPLAPDVSGNVSTTPFATEFRFYIKIN